MTRIRFQNLFITIDTTYLNVSAVRHFGELFFVFQSFIFPVVGHAEQPDSGFVRVRSFDKHYKSVKKKK